MNSICIPIPSLADGRVVEMDVHVGGERHEMKYRVERFDCSPDAGAVERLRRFILDYDRRWELVQVGAREGHFVSLLFRERIPNRA